jgi:hypothetical protein
VVGERALILPHGIEPRFGDPKLYQLVDLVHGGFPTGSVWTSILST